jgi:hypothetical protein
MTRLAVALLSLPVIMSPFIAEGQAATTTWPIGCLGQ